MSNQATVSNVAIIRSVRVETQNVINHYHVYLNASRVLRQQYFDCVKSGQPADVISKALAHYKEARQAYERLCRINGILAAHS